MKKLMSIFLGLFLISNSAFALTCKGIVKEIKKDENETIMIIQLKGKCKIKENSEVKIKKIKQTAIEGC